MAKDVTKTGLIRKALTAIFGEQGKARASYSIGTRWPAVSDDLMTRKGVDVYKAMRNDPDVRSALFTLYGGVLAGGYDIDPSASETDANYAAAKEQAEFVQDCLTQMHGSFIDALEETARDGLGSGASLAERVFVLRPDGKIGFERLPVKDPALYEYDLDEFNNVTGLWLTVEGSRESVDQDKFARFAYQPEHGLPWGTSVLRSAYKWWWAKDQIAGFWWIFLEKYGMPTAKGTFKRGVPKDQQDELLRVLNSIQTETALVIPEDVTVELLEAARGGDAGGFQRAMEYCGKQIAKAIIGQTLTSDEGARVGSLALGKVHQDVLALWTKHLARNLEEWATEEIIRPLVDLNFADPMYPTFRLNVDDRDTSAISEMLFRAEQTGVIDCEGDQHDNQAARELLGLPVRTQDAWNEIEERKAKAADDFRRRLGGMPGQDGEEDEEV